MILLHVRTSNAAVRRVRGGSRRAYLVFGSSDFNFRFCDISSLRVSHENFGSENMFTGVSRHPLSADMVGGVG